MNSDILNDFPAGFRAHFDAVASICGLSAFLMEHGRSFTRVTKCPPEYKGPRGHSYGNAARLALEDSSTRYCEGYAWVPRIGLAVRHGWVLDSDGAVIETTWSDTDATLFFGLVFTREFHVDRLMSKGATWQLWRTEYDLRRWLRPSELQRMLDPRWHPHSARLLQAQAQGAETLPLLR